MHDKEIASCFPGVSLMVFVPGVKLTLLVKFPLPPHSSYLLNSLPEVLHVLSFSVCHLCIQITMFHTPLSFLPSDRLDHLHHWVHRLCGSPEGEHLSTCLCEYSCSQSCSVIGLKWELSRLRAECSYILPNAVVQE